MAWTNPRTWAVSEVVTAALMNTHVRDNLLYLYGQVQTPPYCDLRAGTGTTLTTANTNYALAFDTEVSDASNMHSTSTNTSRITIPAGMGGIYLVTGGYSISTAAANDRVTMTFAVNGTQQSSTYQRVSAGGASIVTVSQTKYIALAAGDYLEILAQTTMTAVTTSIAANTLAYLQARWVGAS